jgi:tRNA(adenine34) deaminase
MIAITQAAAKLGDWRLEGCTLYVTKEPCPMCAGAGTLARLDTIVYGLADSRTGGLGGAAAIHALPGLNHRLETRTGVCADLCRELLLTYFRLARQEPPPSLG